MERSHTPLFIWFWAAYLVASQTPGMSAVQFQRQLGLSRYETAFQILHKLRAGMVRPERDMIGGEYPVEMDECLVGGRSRGTGRGIHDMATVIGAVEVRERKNGEIRAAAKRHTHRKAIPLKKMVYCGRLRLRTIPARAAKELLILALENAAKATVTPTNPWQAYK